MKKIENSFVVSGYISNDTPIRSFETASVTRFSIAVSRSEKKGEETVYTSAFLLQSKPSIRIGPPIHLTNQG